MAAVRVAGARARRWSRSRSSPCRLTSPGPRSTAPGVTGDASVLAYAFVALADVRWATGHRGRAAGDRRGTGDRRDRRARNRTGPGGAFVPCSLCCLSSCAIRHFTVELATFIGLAEQAAIPRYLYLARSRQATAMPLTGPFEAADQAHRGGRRLWRADRRAEHLGCPGQSAGRAGVHPPRLDPAEPAGRVARPGDQCRRSLPCTCGPGCCSRPARRPGRRPWWHRYPTGRRCTGGVIPPC